MACVKCGSELPINSKFCNICGSSQNKEKENNVFAYLCPKCKIPNSKSVTYCVKCGHWLLDSKFPAIPLSEKEYYNHLQTNNRVCLEGRKRNPIFPIFLYSIFAILFISVPILAKVTLSLLIVIFGFINIIYPIKSLFIKKRRVGFAIVFLGIVAISIFSILYSNSVSDVANKTININIPEYKSQCVDISYDNLARDTEKYINTKTKFTGQIIQVQDSGKRLILRVNVTKGDFNTYKDTLWINYLLKSGEKHLLENDVINLWGTIKERKTYRSTLGGEITIPQIDALAIELTK